MESLARVSLSGRRLLLILLKTRDGLISQTANMFCTTAAGKTKPFVVCVGLDKERGGENYYWLVAESLAV
jgi:hypothetical protein